MGGNVAVTVRRHGQEWRMDRWTNALPSVLHDPDFLDGKDTAIQGYLQPWLDMAEDWKAHGPKGPFTHPMTQAYAPYPYGLKPSEYGAVVIDFDTGRILTWQGYCSVGVIDWSAFEFGASADRMNPGKADLIDRLEQRGRVAAMTGLLDRRAARTLAEVEAFPGTTFTATHDANLVLFRIPVTQGLAPLRALGQRMADAYPNRMNTPIRFAQLSVDMAPFQVEEFEETSLGISAMRTRITQLGFTLTQAEQKAWDRAIRKAR